MKRLYWRPQKCSKYALLAIAVLAVIGLLIVECVKFNDDTPLVAEKIEAARLASQCMDVIREQRLKRGYAIDPEIDPAKSGMIGLPVSPTTSIAGHLASKQTSINSNFAAAVVDMLGQAGVRPGDHVAIGCSGSFPALNIAACAACEAMQVEPIIIASAAASQYGANYPDLLWIDMERILNEKGLIHFRSKAASFGGYEDRALGMTDEGRKLVAEAIARNGLDTLDSESFSAAIDQRMEIYHEQSAGRPIMAYINIGGGTISVGRALGKKMYNPGLNIEPPPGATAIDSVMTRFAKAGTPLIHLVQIRDIAKHFELSSAPTITPGIGEGTMYGDRQPSRLLAILVLGAILYSLRMVVLTDWGHRLATRLRALSGLPVNENREPEWMV